MNFFSLFISCSPGSDRDMLIAALSAFGFDGFEEQDDVLIACIPGSGWQAEKSAIEEMLASKGLPFEVRNIPPQNWNAVWEAHFDPVVIGGYCGIRADFHAPLPDVKHEIVITPKMSFGTGHHATTAMMIAHMERLPLKSASVVDFGTGTGILAILAEKEGAARVVAIDNDEWSIANAEENFSRNGCTRIELVRAETIPDNGPFSIVLANINKHIILENIAGIRSAVAPGGWVLLSGLLQEDKEDILPHFPPEEFELKAEKTGGQWLSLLFYVRK